MASMALNSKEFLSSCLRNALDDAELVDDISEQALEHGFSALSIGSGQVTVEQLKNQLYLTVEEATSVMRICASMIAGHQSKDQQDHLTLRLKATPSGRVALNFDAQQSVPQESVPNPATQNVVEGQEPLHMEALDAIMENAAVVVISRTSTNAAGKKLMEVASPPLSFQASATLISPAPAPSPPPASATANVEVPPPAAAPARASSPILPAPAPAASPSSAPATAPGPSASRPAVRTLAAGASAPSTPPKKPTQTAERLIVPEPCPSSPCISSPAVTSSPASIPSYLRATAAHKARTTESEAVRALCAGRTASPVSELPPVAEDGRDLTRRRSLFDRMSSTLLAPTQAFVARVTGRSEELKSKKENPVGKGSAQLDAILCSPHGQRVTKPQPFALRSDARAKSCVLSTEELQLAEAREKAFKRKPVPKHVHESRPIAPKPRSEPKDPQVICEPFQLASVELHKKKMEKMKQKLEEEAAREEEARKFKARAFDPSIKVSPVKPAKPPASPPTRAVAPTFASEARVAYYKAVVEPAKKAKEAEKDKERVEAERKAKELEEMNMDDYRKTLEFKARPMPDFSAPFQPDRSLARPATLPSEPALHTVRRLGAAAAPSAREDKEGCGLGKGVYDGAGYTDPFFASLRKSSSATSSPQSSNPGSKNPSMRRSVMLRQTTTSASRTSSLGTDLQATIRAAASDAARDLEQAGQFQAEPVAMPEAVEALGGN